MKTDFLQANGVKLQYFEHGIGSEVVVLVHGYQSSGCIWQLMQEALDPARFHSIAISNRGAGDSDRTPWEAAYTVDSFAKDLHAAVQSLGLAEFTLVGHSMGGATVTQFALDHPECLKALVLLDPAPLGGRQLAENWEQQLREDFAAGRHRDNMAMDTPGIPEAFRQALAADVARNPIERAVGGIPRIACGAPLPAHLPRRRPFAARSRGVSVRRSAGPVCYSYRAAGYSCPLGSPPGQ